MGSLHKALHAALDEITPHPLTMGQISVSANTLRDAVCLAKNLLAQYEHDVKEAHAEGFGKGYMKRILEK